MSESEYDASPWATTLTGYGLRVRLYLVKIDVQHVELITLAVEVDALHSTGRFLYSASDLIFQPQPIRAFAEALLSVLGDTSAVAQLDDIARAFVLTVRKGKNGVVASVEAEETSVVRRARLQLSADVPDAFVPRARQAMLDLLDWSELLSAAGLTRR